VHTTSISVLGVGLKPEMRDQSPEDFVIFREILQQLQTDINKLSI
jgi:hypothetical protein